MADDIDKRDDQQGGVKKTLTLKGCIVTADALHCHPAMAEGVLAAGADYALGL